VVADLTLDKAMLQDALRGKALTSELPPRVISLWGRHSSRGGPVEQRRAAMCA
jgi:hypothetical protein